MDVPETEGSRTPKAKGVDWLHMALLLTGDEWKVQWLVANPQAIRENAPEKSG